jgi:hypothetical protein
MKIQLIFLIAGMPTSAMLSTMSCSFSSPARTVGSLQQSSPFLSSQPPKEDRYAALKDLDSLMKTQQASSEPQFSDWSTGVVHVLITKFLFLGSGLNFGHVFHICYMLRVLHTVKIVVLLFLTWNKRIGRKTSDIETDRMNVLHGKVYK